MALFLATRRRDAARATLLIERELQKRRDVFTLDAHAWALFAAGRISEAKQRMDEALAAGTVDGRLFLHAAAIEQEYGNHQHAQKWAEKAATVRAMLLPSEGVELDRVRARVAGRSN